MTEFLVGCYTFGAGGRGRRIEVVGHDPATGRWELLTDRDVSEPVAGASSAEQPESPSYLAWHPDGRHVYGVGEVSDGRVWAFEVARGRRGLAVLGSASTGGAHPCHLAVDPSGRVLVTANYTSGSLAVHKLRPDGRIGERTQLVAHEGSGPDRDRQAGPHAHMVYLDGDLVLAVDLGADLVVAYRLDAGAATLTPLASTPMPAGLGPRHLVALPDDLVAVAGELTGEIALLRLERATGALTLLDVRAGSDVTEEPAAPSGIARTADGRHVLMANRGPDTVASFRLTDATLRRVDEIPGGGAHPRDITVVDDRVYVANQESDAINMLRVDLDTGALAGIDSRFSTPSPTQILPMPDAHTRGS
ncbi:MAG TPA: lactonase family protein [Nakamurella sp.]